MNARLHQGCRLAEADGYRRSLTALLIALGLELPAVTPEECSGGRQLAELDPLLPLYLSSRCLVAASQFPPSIVERPSVDTLVTACDTCRMNLRRAEIANRDPLLRGELEAMADETGEPNYCVEIAESGYARMTPAERRRFASQLRILHLSEWLIEQIDPEKLRQRVSDGELPQGLNGLRVAPFIGCLAERPRCVSSGETTSSADCATTRPSSPLGPVEQLMSAAGAILVPLPDFCCASARELEQPDLAHQAALALIHSRGRAQVIATRSPDCHLTLERTLPVAAREIGVAPPLLMPFTQLLGLALGVSARKLGISSSTMKQIAAIVA